MKAMIALVYQAGIANVFEVNSFNAAPNERKAKRLLQHAFHPCEWFTRGMMEAGATVRVFSCNRAGDIAHVPWAEGLEDCPFRDSAKPPLVGRASR